VTDDQQQYRLKTAPDVYRTIVDAIADCPIVLLDQRGVITYCTTAAGRLHQCASGEIIGEHCSAFFTRADRDSGLPDRVLQEARETGRSARTGWRLRRDGSLFWADEITSAVRDAADALAGYCVMTQDRTDHRRSDLERERALRDATVANRLNDEFLSTISHELRTPLNAILGWLQLIRMRGDTVHSGSEALNVIERSARAQARLIDDLLDVSRITAGKVRFAVEAISLAEPLGAALDTVRVAAAQKGIDLRVQNTADDDAVLGDGARLQQIIWNLLSNAVKFTAAGGLVAVDVAAAGDRIELTVADSGVGIERDFLPFVFDRFRQGDASHAREHSGLGLGLSIVKHLVELHGGHVSLESAGPGLGTTARISLPRANRRHRPCCPADESMSASPPGCLTDVVVLIVEDDPDSRRLLELVLEAQGAHVSVAASAQKALAAARATRPRVVLADLAMPRDDGFALLGRLRSEASLTTVPVIAITAHARVEDRDRCLAAGFSGYVPKPIDMNRLLDVIADTLTGRRL
jgi:PAS domain S-box-containing protein